MTDAGRSESLPEKKNIPWYVLKKHIYIAVVVRKQYEGEEYSDTRTVEKRRDKKQKEREIHREKQARREK